MCVVHHVLFSCNYYESKFCFAAAQKARPAGSVSYRLQNEHGEHGAECWLRLNISVFLIAAIVTMLLCNRFLFMYSYDVNVILL